MNICLIDADSKIPNLALMKLSAYHKLLGDKVTLYQANIPYYPNQKKKMFAAPFGYDRYYCSVIFKGNDRYICGNNIEYGGTGYDINKKLPEYVENCEPDYSIYPNNNTSYGFVSRGCIRNCSFCVVPIKEGYIRQVSTPKNIIRHDRVVFLDNNILALPDHKKVLLDVIDCNVRCTFNQGLDIRLLDEENAVLIKKLKYIKELCFAFDDYKLLPVIRHKVRILRAIGLTRVKFYVYVHPDMPLQDTISRIEYLRYERFLPYLMRDIKCWGSSYSDFFTDLASWCNQPQFFKTQTFEEYIKRRVKSEDRATRSSRIYKAFCELGKEITV